MAKKGTWRVPIKSTAAPVAVVEPALLATPFAPVAAPVEAAAHEHIWLEGGRSCLDYDGKVVREFRECACGLRQVPVGEVFWDRYLFNWKWADDVENLEEEIEVLREQVGERKFMDRIMRKASKTLGDLVDQK